MSFDFRNPHLDVGTPDRCFFCPREIVDVNDVFVTAKGQRICAECRGKQEHEGLPRLTAEEVRDAVILATGETGKGGDVTGHFTDWEWVARHLTDVLHERATAGEPAHA